MLRSARFLPALALALALPATPVLAAADAPVLPNLVSLGAGWFDITENYPRKESATFRLEHRWGLSLLPMASPSLAGWDSWFQIHPFAGVEFSSNGQLYGLGGFVFDFLIGRHVVISPNVALGLYAPNGGKRLGSALEFRSTFEAGWRFDNEVRLTGWIGHISNAYITDFNPGANTLGVYVHLPTGVLFGR